MEVCVPTELQLPIDECRYSAVMLTGCLAPDVNIVFSACPFYKTA